jgi:hypothetical protein
MGSFDILSSMVNVALGDMPLPVLMVYEIIGGRVVRRWLGVEEVIKSGCCFGLRDLAGSKI